MITDMRPGPELRDARARFVASQRGPRPAVVLAFLVVGLPLAVLAHAVWALFTVGLPGNPDPVGRRVAALVDDPTFSSPVPAGFYAAGPLSGGWWFGNGPLEGGPQCWNDRVVGRDLGVQAYMPEPTARTALTAFVESVGWKPAPDAVKGYVSFHKHVRDGYGATLTVSNSQAGQWSVIAKVSPAVKGEDFCPAPTEFPYP